MSMIAGVARLDGAPAAPLAGDALPRMAGRFGSRAPHGATMWRGEHAGFSYGALFVTPESAREAQPLSSGDLTIAFDGRLDNRVELIAALDAERDAGDAALVLRAYAKWGDAAAEHLLGDFAFAVWDAPNRRLYCARDTSGVRPFFYREGHGWIAWASELDILAAGVDGVPPPNEGMAGEYLAGVITSTRETLFQGIFRLPPAHALTASAAGIRTRRYWAPDPGAEIRYRHDADYEAHLADLMSAAVAARLRTNHPAGIMLSGGIDSSSVTAIAARACRSGSVPCPGLRTFSIDVAGPNEDRPYFDAMIEASGLPAERFSPALPRPGQFREEIARDLDIPTFPQAPTIDPVRARVRDSGARALLTGVGSDDWLGPSTWAYADLLRRGRLVALGRRAWSESRTDDFPGWPFAWQSAIWPLAPAPVQRLVRRALRRGRPPAWIDPAFAARINLADRLAQRQPDVDFQTCEQIDLWREGMSGRMVHSIEATSRAVSRFGLDHAHPFLDRRIVEFGLALPSDQRGRNGRHKDLLRRTMARHLPPAIVERLSSPAGDYVYIQALESEQPAGSQPAPSACESLGWVRGPEALSARARARHMYQSGRAKYAWPARVAWLVLAMDLWLDAVVMVQ